jgi:hypothetical protein
MPCSIGQTIDGRLEKLARALCKHVRYDPDYAFKIEGGGFVPGWALFVSEADAFIQKDDLMAEVRKLK